MKVSGSKHLLIFGLSYIFLTSAAQVPQKTYRFENEGLSHTAKAELPELKIKEESSDILELEYSFESFSVYEMPDKSDTYQLVRIPGFGLSDKVGAPALPVKTEKVIIPEGKEARVSIARGEYEEIQDIYLYPAQEPGSDGVKMTIPFSRDESAYKVRGFLPLNLANITNEQTFRGVRIAYLQIRPVQYNAVSRTLRVYKDLKVTVEFVDAAKSLPDNKKILRSGAYDILRNSVLNKNSIPAKAGFDKTATDVQPKGYLIVTVPEFEDAADTLAKWKRQLGYHVEVYAQDDWTVSSVKSLVSDVYNNSSYDFEYLLLFGDYEHIPDYYYQDINGVNPWHIYSTNYFACMDGSSDYTPEMAHARISVVSADQALMVVKKQINYEKNPPADPGFYNQGIHAGYFQDSTFDGQSDYRYCRTSIEMYDYMAGQGMDNELILYAESGSDPRYFNPYFSGLTDVPSQYLRSNGYQWDGNKDDIVSAWNEGILYAFHRDHGLRDQWMAPYFHVSHMDELTNGDKLPIVFSVNCGTGKFNLTEPNVCFAEKLQRHPNGGAVGIVAATAETKSGFNDGLIIGMMDAIWPNPGIIPDMGMGNDTATLTPHGQIYHMGDVMLQGLLRMTETWSTSGWADRHQYHLYHYFGDPALQVWTEQPVQLTASHAGQLEVGASSLSLSGVNAQDALATITIGDELIDLALISDGSGTLTFPAIDESVTEVTLTINQHNYIPYIVVLKVLKTPVPDFEADIIEFCAGEVVQFSDLSTGIVDEWAWNIDPAGVVYENATNSSSQNPEIRFNTPGQYTISLTVSNSFGDETEEKVNYINVYAIPDAPETQGANRCFDADIPELLAEGTNIKWYSDAELTSLINEGNSFTPASAEVGTIRYYLTQTENGCVSDTASVSLTTFAEVEAPEVAGMTVCDYDTAILVATGTNIQWYSDSLGNTLEGNGDSLLIYPLSSDEYTWYASQTVNGCKSELTPGYISVLNTPDIPVAADTNVCVGELAVLNAEGEHIYWYSSEEPETPLYFGNTYEAGILPVGLHTYLITQEVSNCTSDEAEVEVNVHALPEFSLGEDTTIYDYDTLALSVPVEGSYLWSDGTDDNSFYLIGAEYGIGIHTLWLDVTTEYNCFFNDSLIVEVIKLIDSLPINFQGNIITLFPNPTKGNLQLKFLQSVEKPVNLIITDPKGALLYRLEGLVADPSELMELNLSGISDGMYFLSIYNEDIWYREVFVKE